MLNDVTLAWRFTRSSEIWDGGNIATLDPERGRLWAGSYWIATSVTSHGVWHGQSPDLLSQRAAAP